MIIYGEPVQLKTVEELVDNNHKISNEIKSKVLTKMSQLFTKEEQELYVNSLLMYLNHHPNDDFIIDLADVYKSIGYTRLDNAKRVLVKNFSEGTDYQTLLHRSVEQKNQIVNLGENQEENFSEGIAPQNLLHRSMEQKTQILNLGGNQEENFSEGSASKNLLLRSEEQNLENRGGSNKERIMMNINTFKMFCMMAQTTDGRKIQSYFVKLETIIHEVLIECIKNSERILDRNTIIHFERIAKSEQIIKNFNKKTIVYVGRVDQSIYKFGHTSSIVDTEKRHKASYGNDFVFKFAIESNSRVDLESKIKNDERLQPFFLKQYRGQSRQELLKLNSDLTLQTLIDIIENYEKEFKMAENPVLLAELEKTRHLQTMYLLEKQRTKQVVSLEQEKERTKLAEIQLKQTEIEEKTKLTEIEIQSKERTKLAELQLEEARERTKLTQLQLEEAREKTKQTEIKQETIIKLAEIQANKHKTKIPKEPKPVKVKPVKEYVIKEPKIPRKLSKEEREEADFERSFKMIPVVEEYVDSITYQTNNPDDLIDTKEIFKLFHPWYCRKFRKNIGYERFRSTVCCIYNIDYNKRISGEWWLGFRKWT